MSEEKISVLYEDDVIIVVNKPAGMPSQATLDPARDNCYDAVRRYLAKKQNSPYAGLHHRLDAMTSGAILMTKDVTANASISDQFQRHTVVKTYCAICTGTTDIPEQYRREIEEFLISAPIGEIPGGRIQKFGIDGKKRKSARTRVVCETSVVLRDGVFCVYRCSPETGRTHQIRVHLSSFGAGIVGDALYGSPMPRSLRCYDPGRMCLHAEAIRFVHPLTREIVEVRAPRPECMTSFARKARSLGRR